jgi:hypothetical protein
MMYDLLHKALNTFSLIFSPRVRVGQIHESESEGGTTIRENVKPSYMRVGVEQILDKMYLHFL